MPAMEPDDSSRSEGGARHALRRTFHSLATRNFRLFFIGQLISNTGNWLTNVAIILLVLRLTGSGFYVGLLAAFQFGPMLVLGPVAGTVADRWNKRRLLFWTQGLEMGQSVGLAILAFLPHPPLTGLFALALAGGILLSFDNPLRRSFVAEMVSSDDLPNAVVLYSTIVNLSRVFGPTLAGLLAVTIGFGWCFTLDAASYLAVLLCLAMMRASELFEAPPATEVRGAVRAALRYVGSLRFLQVSFVLFGVVGLFSFNLRVILPLFVTDSLHRSDVVFTVLYSIFSLGAVANALFVAHRRLIALKHVLLGTAALGATFLLLGATPGVVTAALAVFLVGMASILFSTAVTAIVQVSTRRDMHGRLLALQTSLIGGTALAGGPLLGWIADRFGGRAPFFLGGTVCLLAAAVGWLASGRSGNPSE